MEMIPVFPFPDSEKLIAGSPHVAVPCSSCGDRIYVAKKHEMPDGTYTEQCYDCKPRSRPKRRASDKATGADIRYHGEDGER